MKTRKNRTEEILNIIAIVLTGVAISGCLRGLFLECTLTGMVFYGYSLLLAMGFAFELIFPTMTMVLSTESVIKRYKLIVILSYINLFICVLLFFNNSIMIFCILTINYMYAELKAIQLAKKINER